MSSLYGIGLSSLFASQYAIMLSNQNIANSENPSYSRRVVDFKEMAGAGVGNGIKLWDVRRVVDDFANHSLLQATCQYAAADSYAQSFKLFEPQFDNTSGLDTYFKESLTQLNSVNTSASSSQSRSSYLYQLNTISTRFNQLSDQLKREQLNLSQSVADNVNEVNAIARQLAQINSQLSGSASPTVSDNLSLFDERDRLLSKLAEYINFNSYTDERGITNVTLANGIQMISGLETFAFSTAPSVSNTAIFDIMMDNGSSTQLVTPYLTSGKISGQLAFQKDGLSATARGLDRLALAFSMNLNQQNRLGMDLYGNIGGDILTDLNAPGLSNSRVIAATTNAGSSGTLAVNITDSALLTDSDYQLIFDSATHYQLFRESDHQLVGEGKTPNPLSVDGFTLDLSNANAVQGDRFTVSPTRGAASALKVTMTDPSQLALAYPVVTNPSSSNIGGGVMTVSDITNTSTSAFATKGQLSPPLTVQFVSGNQYQLVNSQTGAVIEGAIQYVPGASIFPTPGGYDPGFRITLDGQVSAQDQFQISYNQSGLNDNRNGLKIASLYQEGTLKGGQLNFIQGYQSLTADISAKTHVAKMVETTQNILKTQAEKRRDEISGVSLEEEALNIARFQQSYQASAKILEVVTNMFDVILNLARR
jgi:flagellar hook-associated protein 1 FlgK